MKIEENIFNIAKQVRCEILNLQIFDSVTLCGACAVASYKLYKTLKESGENAIFVSGIYSHGHCFSDHCWVELDGKIIDITYKQFKPNGPRVFVCKNTCPSYKVERTNGKALEFIEKNWISNQRPSKILKNLK